MPPTRQPNARVVVSSAASEAFGIGDPARFHGGSAYRCPRTGNTMTPRAGVAAPNTIPWPPLIAGGVTIAAVVLGRLVPLDSIISGGARLLGGAIMLVGLSLDISAMLAMWRHHANILPHRAATALVTSWPFSVSRNPIYLGNTVMLAGAAFAFANPWFIAMAAVAVQAVLMLAIKREEAHLAASFGAEWDNYAAHVPRWLRL